jgi:hypothetical protein
MMAEHDSLDVFNTRVDAQVRLMSAWSDWNQAVMEIYKQQLQMCSEVIRVEQLRDAIREFNAAQRRVSKQISDLKRMQRRISSLTRASLRLLRGDIPEGYSAIVWRSFEQLIGLASADTVILLDRIDYNGEPVLCALADRPDIGTDSVLREALRVVFQVLADGAKKDVAAIGDELAKANADLDELRKTRWDQVKAVGQPRG